MNCRLLPLAVLLALAASRAAAQENLRAPIDWRVMHADKYDIHYPSDDYLPRAREVAQWLQNAQTRMEKELDQSLDGPVNVLIYPTLLEANQHFQSADNPGQIFPVASEARRRRIVIPCLGSNRAMQRTLEFQLAQVLIDQRLYGTSSLQASLLDFKTDLYPAWLLRGIAAHEAGPVFPVEEMLVRDAVLDGELPGLSVLHAFDSRNIHERYPMLVQAALAVGWIQGGTPKGSAKRLMHVFDSDFPFPTDRHIQRACGISYDDVEKRFARAMKERYREWAGKEEAERFARRIRGHEQFYRFYELAPVPSPDGRRVAFFEDSARYYDLVVLDRETGEESHPLRLELHLTIDAVHPYARGIDWSPDGKSLCFAGDNLAVNWLYIKPLEGGPARSIHPPCDDVMSPQWSPDGRSIVFVGLRKGGQDLYVLDVATSDVRRLTTAEMPESDPAWSPDGKSIAFAGETGGQSDLWRVDVATGRVERITDTPCDEIAPSFRPDGTAITFAADPGGAFNIYSLEFATGAVTRHTDVPGGAFAPRWSPDGREILFSSYRHGRFTTWAMPPRTAAAAADFRDPACAAAAQHFTLGAVEKFVITPYETRMRFESLLPTSASLSDIPGHHIVDSYTNYKFPRGGFDVGYEITYTNRSLRPDLFITGSVLTRKDPSSTDHHAGFEFGASYPFDASTRAGLSVFVTRHNRTAVSKDNSDQTLGETLENGAKFRVTRRNITRRRQNPVSGYSIDLNVTWWIPALASDIDRVNYSGEGRLYVELWHDHVVAFRIGATHSTGPDRERLNLKDKVRGYDSGDPHGTDLAWAGAEFRFPVWRDIDWALPGQVILLKDIRASAFVDAGVITDEENVMNMLAYPVREEWHCTAGASIQFDLYLFERKYFPVIFTLARALDRTEEAPKGLPFEVTFEVAY